MPTNRAHNRIRTLIRNGLFEKASEFPCFMCGEKAQHYHHFNGYDGENAYRVLPLCFSCHRRITEGTVPRSAKFTERHSGHKIVEWKYKGRVRLRCHTCTTNRRLQRRIENG